MTEIYIITDCVHDEVMFTTGSLETAIYKLRQDEKENSNDFVGKVEKFISEYYGEKVHQKMFTDIELFNKIFEDIYYIQTSKFYD